MNILQINSSARTAGSHSTALANTLSQRLLAANPGAELVLRDLTTAPHPALDEATLGALFTPADSRSADQSARVDRDGALIAELLAADVLVIGVPMYNFGISSQLKNWIDAIAKAGVTFKYTETGPVGLVTGKKAYVALARGGIYRDTANDTQVPFLKMLLGFIGITDVQFFYAEGLAMGPEAEAGGLASARAQIEEALPA
jgi:FMN-dependent NADH-azoreductase